MQIFEVHSQVSDKGQKTKQDYSRNVKKLKYKLSKVQNQIQVYSQRIKSLQNTSNDQVISMKISKFCKERRFTPEMLFRFADTKCKNSINRAQFKNTFTSIGLKLSQEQLTRLQYLLDQDISGEISWQEYNKYLHAFGIKKQVSTDDPFVKDALRKLDINKILQMDKDKSKEKKHRTLLNYEQFLQYCHREFPGLKDKQLIVIFRILSKDDLIDLDDLIQYLTKQSKKQSQKQRKKLQEEQRRKKKFPDEDQELINIQEEQEEKIDISTLKGKIMAVLVDHPIQQQTFHSSEFKRIESQKEYISLIKKGQMVRIFKEIDMKNLCGSIGYDQIIEYFVIKESDKAENLKPNQTLGYKDQIQLKYTFILMGKKIVSQGSKPQSLIEIYANQKGHITPEEFEKMSFIEFQLKKNYAKIIYSAAVKDANAIFVSKQGYLSTQLLIKLMKFSKKGFRPVVKPMLQGDFSNYLYKKQTQTICTNGLIAFKICNSLRLQIPDPEKWHDYEFGPTAEDQFGFDSISRNNTTHQVRWIRTSNLKMNQFYISPDREDKIFKNGLLGQNDMFNKSLQMLVKRSPSYLNRKISEVAKNGKNIEETQLNKIFEGLHPLVFHQFQKKGIIVIKFYVKARWVYVIIDDKIPCDMKNKPLFSRSTNKMCSYVSLVEKAYAKLKGSYEKIFESASLSKYIYELSSILSYSQLIENMQRDEDDETQWKKIFAQTNKQVEIKKLKKANQNLNQTQISYLTNQISYDRKVRSFDKSGIEVNFLLHLCFSLELKDKKAAEKIHKLMLIHPQCQLRDQQSWNPQWCGDQQLFKTHAPTIKTQIAEWNKENPNIISNFVILDFQRVQNMFNSLLVTKSIDFNGDMVIMRKYLQFEKEFSCLYKVNCTQNQKTVKLIILLNKINAPEDARVIVRIKSCKQDSKVESKNFVVKGQFGCICLQIPSDEQDIQIKVDKFQPNQDYIYQLTFYFDSPRYSLKERDRHLLFRYVSAYQQSPKLELDILSEQQKSLFIKFFPNLGRKSVMCC